MMGYIIGIDAGGTKVAYGLFHGDKLIDRFQHPTDTKADGPAFSDEVAKNVKLMLQKNSLEFSALEGVGVCMPSFILHDTGYVCMTSAMPNIRDFPMRDYLSEKLPVKVALDNDSNVAALAEHRHGAGLNSRHMVYVAISTGLGSGIIIDGKLFHGSYGWAGECGHMLITPDEGIECGCRNRGCYMAHASGRYVPMQVKLRLEKGEKSVLSDCEDLDCKAILEAYNKNDALAISVVNEMAHYLAVCLFNVYQLLNINLFVFGGGLVHYGDALFKPMRKEFDRYNHIELPVDFRFAQLGSDFGIIGAAELIKE